MEKDMFLLYAQSDIERLHSDPSYAGYFSKTRDCLLMLKIFQFMTIAIIILLAIRFRTFDEKSSWKANKIILAVSGIVLTCMIVYESYNYACMSRGIDGIPFGLQFVALLAVLFFYFCKKDY